MDDCNVKTLYRAEKKCLFKYIKTREEVLRPQYNELVKTIRKLMRNAKISEASRLQHFFR